jgi:hypothetical protein
LPKDKQFILEEDMDLIQNLKICMLKFSTSRSEYMASANVGLNCMENTILILAIILIISKRSAR